MVKRFHLPYDNIKSIPAGLSLRSKAGSQFGQRTVMMMMMMMSSFSLVSCRHLDSLPHFSSICTLSGPSHLPLHFFAFA